MSDNLNRQGMGEGSVQTQEEMVSTVTAAVVKTLMSMENAPQGKTERAAKDANQPKTIDLIGLMFYVFEKFWLVIILAVLCAGVFGFMSRNARPSYTATAKLYIVNPANTGINIADLQLGTVLTLDYQEVFKTWEVHEMVRKELNLPYSYEQMQSMISVVNPEDTRLLYIYATYFDAQTAADIANAYAKAAKEFIIETMRGEEPSDFSIALVPSVAQMQSHRSSVIKGFLLGSVLAVGILVLLFVLDDRPRTPEDISDYAGIPTLAVLPATKGRHRPAHSAGRKPRKDE